MFKPILLLTLVIFLSACTFPLVNVEQQLTFEERFEIQIKNCNLLKTYQQINDCKDNILLQQALSLDDIIYCDYSSNLRAVEICQSLFFLNKAEKNKNPAFCNFIDNKVINEICLNSI